MRVVSERLGHASAVMTLTVNQQSTPMWAAGSGRLRRAAGQLIRGRSSRAAFTGPLFDLNVRTAGLELAESRRASVSEGDTPHVHAPDRGLSQLARCGGEHPAPAPAISVLGLRRPEPPPASAQGIGRPSRRSGSQPPESPNSPGRFMFREDRVVDRSSSSNAALDAAVAQAGTVNGGRGMPDDNPM